MGLNFLNQYNTFAIDAFLRGLVLYLIGIAQWIDYDTKKVLGTKLIIVIHEDKNVYKQKDGQNMSNVYEKLEIKIPKDIKDVNIPINSVIVPINATASIYGDYRNKLSIKADDVKIVQHQHTQPTPSTQQAQQAKAVQPKTI